MTITELHIQLDLQPENKINVLEDVARKCNEGYLFVDSLDGHCYLFDRNGNEDDIKKIKSIEIYEFENYRNLKSIVIPDSVRSIGDYAFENCKSLESIIIHDSVKSIGNWAFSHCENLTSIEIPHSVKNIGNWAFSHCENLTSIEIPHSVKNIGIDAFWRCESLKSLTFKEKTMKQVKAMYHYPWGIEDYPWEIEDESIIKIA